MFVKLKVVDIKGRWSLDANGYPAVTHPTSVRQPLLFEEWLGTR
jgi:hypothetical protein